MAFFTFHSLCGHLFLILFYWMIGKTANAFLNGIVYWLNIRYMFCKCSTKFLIKHLFLSKAFAIVPFPILLKANLLPNCVKYQEKIFYQHHFKSYGSHLPLSSHNFPSVQWYCSLGSSQTLDLFWSIGVCCPGDLRKPDSLSFFSKP